MKKISTAAWILLILCASAFAEIADIEKNGDWYYLYNQKVGSLIILKTLRNFSKMDTKIYHLKC